MALKLYDNFLDAQTGFAGMFKLRQMTPAQLEFRQKLIDKDAAPHKVKQWPIKTKDEVIAMGGNWPNDALPPMINPFVRFIDGEENKQYLTNDAWEELFKDFATALREMKSKENRLKLEPTVKKFIDDYYPIFGQWSLPVDENGELNHLIHYIEAHTDVRNILMGFNVFSKPAEITNFIKEIRNKEFSDDNKYKIQQIVTIVQNFGGTHPYNGINIPAPGTPYVGLGVVSLDDVVTALNTETVVPGDLTRFKGKFTEMYSKIATLPKVKAAFGATSTGGGIVTYMKEADEIYDFDNKESENFIDEKIEDELNPIESFQKNFNDKVTEHLGRLKRRHDGWPYKSPQAEAIVEAMYKEGFTPQQGLDWILTNKDKVIARLGAGHESVGRFKWMCDQLELAKKKQKVAFRDALYNGQKLKAIKEEMKVNVPKTNAKAKYKVASEVLTVIQYEDFSTFSDQEFWKNNKIEPLKETSFMKNETLKPIVNAATTAFNWILKTGVRVGKVAVRKINKLIAATTKTKRLTALEAKLGSDLSKAQDVMTAFGPAVNATVEDIRLKEEEIAGYQATIDEINGTDDGKELIEKTEKREKIKKNIDSMSDAIIQLNTTIVALPPGPERDRLTRERDNINVQMTNYITGNGVTVIVPYVVGTPGTYTTGLDASITALEAIADLTALNTTLDTQLNTAGFDRWEYDHAKYALENAQTKIDDIAEMNAFDKELDATTRSYNIFRNIKDQRKVWYAQNQRA